MNEEPDYLALTELAGDEVSQEQIERLCQRYVWASGYCDSKDVLEAACGTGQGLGCLGANAKSLVGGDFEPRMLEIAGAHYGDRFQLVQLDAHDMPFDDDSFDVIVLFEAIYYLSDAKKFVLECKRLLRAGGVVLIATANKDLFDFNPSPHSYQYYGVVELEVLFSEAEFETEFFATTPVAEISVRQKILRPIKKAAVSLGLIPKSMKGKKILKKLIFGSLLQMPAEIQPENYDVPDPVPIPAGQADTGHKVILCAASLKS